MKTPKNARIIQIDITNACVHKCSNCTRFCGHHHTPFFMDFNTFKKAVDSLKGFHGTIGMIGGEPVLHPEFKQFVEYLYSKIPEKDKNHLDKLVFPQSKFIEAVRENERKQNILCKKGKKLTVTNRGMGLWSAVPSLYMKYYELIQDTFNKQLLNDHGNIMYHQPIMITRKELGIPDEEWLKLRNNCWINQEWSPTITPKGAFFCEVAGAMDMLFDGPGGWPIEAGWWKREEKDFGDQLSWCEMCGVPLSTFSRDAREEVDDVSPIIYDKLLKIKSPKVLNNHVNVLKIKNHEIMEESKKTIFTYRANAYTEGDLERISKQAVIYPKHLDGLIIDNDATDLTNINNVIAQNTPQFDSLSILMQKGIVDKIADKEIEKQENTKKLGQALMDVFARQKDGDYLVIMSGGIIVSDDFGREIKNLVINPGTLHYEKIQDGVDGGYGYIKNSAEVKEGFIVLLNKNASSIERIGQQRFSQFTDIKELIEEWDSQKIVPFNKDMIYTPQPRTIAKRITNLIKNTGQYFLLGDH